MELVNCECEETLLFVSLRFVNDACSGLLCVIYAA